MLDVALVLDVSLSSNLTLVKQQALATLTHFKEMSDSLPHVALITFSEHVRYDVIISYTRTHTLC